jgi:hypothetical protein
MSQPGHFWCDKCDDVAFGRYCQQCHQPARFVPDHISSRKHKPRAVAPERAALLFHQLKEMLK